MYCNRRCVFKTDYVAFGMAGWLQRLTKHRKTQRQLSSAANVHDILTTSSPPLIMSSSTPYRSPGLLDALYRESEPNATATAEEVADGSSAQSDVTGDFAAPPIPADAAQDVPQAERSQGNRPRSNAIHYAHDPSARPAAARQIRNVERSPTNPPPDDALQRALAEVRAEGQRLQEVLRGLDDRLEALPELPVIPEIGSQVSAPIFS
jgi:hypothetical protein